jgi:ESCRT-II complex subunit VPS36
MAVRRWSRSIDGTIPVRALLYDDEELLASQEGVGIYDGLQKSAEHPSGVVHVSTHRLFYVDERRPGGCSFAVDLGGVGKTESYGGLFKSSPKVTLHFAAAAAAPETTGSSRDDGWVCMVCSYQNPPGLSPTAARICALCGVPRASTPVPTPTPTRTPTRTPTPASAAVSCPACTFLNDRSRSVCEMCGGPLPGGGSESGPDTRVGTPDGGDVIRLSFRKGGDRAFYAVLRRSLLGKAWEAKESRKGSAGISEFLIL